MNLLFFLLVVVFLTMAFLGLVMIRSGVFRKALEGVALSFVILCCIGGPIVLFAHSFSSNEVCEDCALSLAKLLTNVEHEATILSGDQEETDWSIITLMLLTGATLFLYLSFVASMFFLITQLVGYRIRPQRILSVVKGLLLPSLLAASVFYLVFLLVPILNSFVERKSVYDTLNVDMKAVARLNFGIFLAIFSVAAAVQGFYRTSGVHYSAASFLERLTEELRLLEKDGGDLVVHVHYLLIGYISVVPGIHAAYTTALEGCLNNPKVNCRIYSRPIDEIEKEIDTLTSEGNNSTYKVMSESREDYITKEKRMRSLAHVNENFNSGNFVHLEEQNHHFFVVGTILFILDMRLNEAIKKGIDNAMIVVEIREPSVARRYVESMDDLSAAS